MSVSEGIHRLHDTEPRPQRLPQRSPSLELLPKPKSNKMGPQRRHIFVVMGPAGCGKSTVAGVMAEKLGLPYVEGDELHPVSNVQKMGAGIPLTDQDRWDWLISVRRRTVKELSERSWGVFLSCSALKHKYRDVLRIAALENHNLSVHFLYLHADESVLLRRVGARQGHFMKATMVRQQLASLERPSGVEKDMVMVDGSQSTEKVVMEALKLVGVILNEGSNTRGG